MVYGIRTARQTVVNNLPTSFVRATCPHPHGYGLIRLSFKNTNSEGK